MLEQNYRSTPQILAAANALMAEAGSGYAKRLFSLRPASLKPRLVTVADEAAQARWVADEVLRQRESKLPLKRQAVLFRTSHHSAPLELELARRNIPFVKFGGLRFFESAHVKDLVSLLRWAQTPRSRLAGQRVLRLVPGIGSSAAAKLLDALDAAADPAAALLAHVPTPRVQAEWEALKRTVQGLRDPALPWLDALPLARAWYTPHLKRLHENARQREADLDQLQRIATGFSSAERFLTELSLDPPAASSDEAADPLLDEDYLILSTIHSAKGQEWGVVNVVDGCMPSDMATRSVEEIEEERRLLYVAMTRARDELNLVVPQRFHVTQQRHHGDRHLYAVVSRFITPAVRSLFDEWTPVEAKPGEQSDEGPMLLDVAALARQRFLPD
jgi:DNA helicase II / ATP-dependent DNA helicase PcrA